METYNGQEIIGCGMAEKYDGVQGVWDGDEMKTRSGNIISIPLWVKDLLPKQPLTGELWMGRGRFDKSSALVRRKDSHSSPEWKQVKFMVFDYCLAKNDFIQPVEWIKVKSKKQFTEYYNRVVADGGEGVVVKVKGEFLKHKPTQDADGVLVGYSKGSGRNSNTFGSFIIRLPGGHRLKVGGISDEKRNSPPEIGAVIRFEYSGLTSKGLPRFAKFAGVRAETSLTFTNKNKPEIKEKAKVTNTWHPEDKGAKKLKKQYPGLIKVRRYKMPDGSIKKTVEIEIEQ